MNPDDSPRPDTTPVKPGPFATMVDRPVGLLVVFLTLIVIGVIGPWAKKKISVVCV